MAGIFGIISKNKNNCQPAKINNSFCALTSRGRNSSAVMSLQNNFLNIYKSRKPLNDLWGEFSSASPLIVGFAGLNASHPSEISPVVKQGYVLFHDGLLTNSIIDETEFRVTTPSFSHQILDSILALKNTGLSVEQAIQDFLDEVKGTVNCLLVDTLENVIYLFSNHGSLYYKESDTGIIVASEAIFLEEGVSQAQQVKKVKFFDLPFDLSQAKIEENVLFNYTPGFQKLSAELNVLQYNQHNLKRCAKCILPETMPYIRFDAEGVCNYCHSYKLRNKPKNIDKFLELLDPYRKASGYECVVPFSGGRDSCAALHLIVNELNLKPITYTYDWGMVTDVGRRNVAIMSGKMGVENIVIADNIERKRKNIAMNFKAWLKKPDLGMINILTAGDKHFFRYVNKVKNDTGVGLNLWGVNPLEVTHFKTGFLGIEPDFEKQRVYASGKLGQLHYHSKRFARMVKSPGYFNPSLWDTYTGEYYRSFAGKKDFFHIFDYWQWNEDDINAILDSYGWERAIDTPTTWRIGDGTAGIFNYIYYTMAGFTEHDTFRSNQVREGEITRDDALKLIQEENSPCFNNIRWYLQSIGFDFVDTIRAINAAHKQHVGLYDL